MEDLSLHVLDIAENSFCAGATALEVTVSEESVGDLLVLTITDNGKGMAEDDVEKACDPFYTTRTTRRVGLGLGMLRHAARAADGDMSIESRPAGGTKVTATFRLSSIDRQPLGAMAETITALVAARPEADITYRHDRDGSSVRFASRDFTDLQRPLNSAGMLCLIRDYLALEEQRLGHQQQA